MLGDRAINCQQCSKEIDEAYCSDCMMSAADEADTAIDETQWEADQVESERMEDMQYAAFATGMPDLFSDEMREFWDA